MKIQLLFPSCLKDDVLAVQQALKNNGYPVVGNPKVFDPEELGIAIFEKNMDVEAYLSEIPVLKEQLNYSSIKHFRVLPLFIYDGSKDDPEALFEEETGEFVEEIFSGEFKPYGWDVSKSNNIIELIEIIEENYTE